MGNVMRVGLFDRRINEIVAAEITTMTDREVELLNSTWVPAFQQRYHHQLRDEDFLMWQTGKGYLDLLIHREELQSYVLIADEMVQGVLVLWRHRDWSTRQPKKGRGSAVAAIKSPLRILHRLWKMSVMRWFGQESSQASSMTSGLSQNGWLRLMWLANGWFTRSAFLDLRISPWSTIPTQRKVAPPSHRLMWFSRD
jgi:hypothetical protein